MQDFHKLQVWHKSHHLALRVYEVTRNFPKDELYGLVSQSRRCAVSVASNIAEGCGRSSPGDFVRFLEIASGSASELQCQLLLARDLRFLAPAEHALLDADICEVKQMLASLAQKVRHSYRSAKTP